MPGKRYSPFCTIIYCFLHAFISIRDRCKKKYRELFSEISEAVWNVFKAENKCSFSQRIRRLREKLWKSSVKVSFLIRSWLYATRDQILSKLINTLMPIAPAIWLIDLRDGWTGMFTICCIFMAHWPRQRRVSLYTSSRHFGYNNIRPTESVRMKKSFLFMFSEILFGYQRKAGQLLWWIKRSESTKKRKVSRFKLVACKEFAINKEAVIKKGMKRNKARDIVGISISPEITAALHVKSLWYVCWQCVRYDNNNGL